MNILKRSIKRIFSAAGLEIRRKPVEEAVRMPVELRGEEKDMVAYVRENNLTLTSYERLWATAMACKHAIERGIDGDFVECGVWRGGNSLLAAAIFKQYKSDKKIYLFDTFAGMTPPAPNDRYAAQEHSVLAQFNERQRDSHNEWCFASLDDVRNNFINAGLLSDNIIFVQGDVVQTLASEENLPKSISVLRLDTDWYESTKKELEVLYPRLNRGGVLLIDDYGYWAGSKQATDEFFEKNQNRPFLQYSDPSGRAAVKFD